MTFPLALGTPGGTEMLVILVVAVSLFGKRLPEVARSLGKSFSEFKRGISGLENEFRAVTSEVTNPNVPSSTTRTATEEDNEDDRREAVAPKFVPPSAAPQEETADS
ncbi:MAG: twin-arginine translocase TatA/TatE family subunit [Planctomycetota bacterium]|nr:MAG: twin-arginine translocase TatA/TatE family subunit [Planctomycetota bacterium]